MHGDGCKQRHRQRNSRVSLSDIESICIGGMDCAHRVSSPVLLLLAAYTPHMIIGCATEVRRAFSNRCHTMEFPMVPHSASLCIPRPGACSTVITLGGYMLMCAACWRRGVHCLDTSQAEEAKYTWYAETKSGGAKPKKKFLLGWKRSSR